MAWASITTRRLRVIRKSGGTPEGGHAALQPVNLQHTSANITGHRSSVRISSFHELVYNQKTDSAVKIAVSTSGQQDSKSISSTRVSRISRSSQTWAAG
jgi:hypothetical protein